MTSYSIDVRCPIVDGPQRLFMKLRISDSVEVVDGNLMEFACSDCKRTLRKQGFEVDRVLHQYNFLGEFVQTFLEN